MESGSLGSEEKARKEEGRLMKVVEKKISE